MDGPVTVWKDANEAAIKWSSTLKPKTLDGIIEECHNMWQDSSVSSEYKVGYFYGAIQLLETEMKIMKAERSL
jgi:hypothetical protein